MGEKQVERAVAVQVVGDHAHARLGLTVKVVRRPQDQRVVAEVERARVISTFVDPQLVGVGVVGHVDVLPAVAVDVEADDPQAGGEGRRDARALADVGEPHRAA